MPAGLEKGSIEDFLAKLPKYDATMRDRYESAKGRGKVLRYVGRLTSDGQGHPWVWSSSTRSMLLQTIALNDNVVRFATRRYCNNTRSSCRAPGAGPEVTAGGVFADLLRLAALSRSTPVSQRVDRATAFAPASVGNVAIGFDILGFCVDALGDKVTVTRRGATGRHHSRDTRCRRRPAARAGKEHPPVAPCSRSTNPRSLALASTWRSKREFRWARAWEARRPRPWARWSRRMRFCPSRAPSWSC